MKIDRRAQYDFRRGRIARFEEEGGLDITDFKRRFLKGVRYLEHLSTRASRFGKAMVLAAKSPTVVEFKRRAK